MRWTEAACKKKLEELEGRIAKLERPPMSSWGTYKGQFLCNMTDDQLDEAIEWTSTHNLIGALVNLLRERMRRMDQRPAKDCVEAGVIRDWWDELGVRKVCRAYACIWLVVLPGRAIDCNGHEVDISSPRLLRVEHTDKAQYVMVYHWTEKQDVPSDNGMIRLASTIRGVDTVLARIERDANSDDTWALTDLRQFVTE